MSESEEEQLFKLDGASGGFHDISEHAVVETDDSACSDLNPAAEDSMSSPAKFPIFTEQESTALTALDDGAMSADRALFDDLLRQRIAKVNRVSADVSRQLDALKKPS